MGFLQGVPKAKHLNNFSMTEVLLFYDQLGERLAGLENCGISYRRLSPIDKHLVFVGRQELVVKDTWVKVLFLEQIAV